MSSYYTLDVKKPDEGQEVYVCTVVSGVYRMVYENGWFVRRASPDNDQLLLSERAILKWKPVPASMQNGGE